MGKIIVNLDVEMAKRKISSNDLATDRYHACQPVHPEDGQSKSHPLLYAVSYLQVTELPAGRYPGIS